MKPATIKNSELIEETFGFWFSDHDHIRSPFPIYIHQELRNKSLDKFYHWISRLEKKPDNEVDEKTIQGKLEEIIFETGLELVKTEDEKLTIYYPFLPRTGDLVNPGKSGNPESGEISRVMERYLEKESDRIFLRVKLKTKGSGKKWETSFELPA